MPAQPAPAAEIEPDEDLVRGLLEDQAPHLARLPLTRLTSGWDNVIFRLGDGLSTRLPRRLVAANLIEHEQQWLPMLATRLPLPVPAPVVAGAPGRGYPWHWSVNPWFEGSDFAVEPPRDLVAAAEMLGAFTRALHVSAPADAPTNPLRGGPLATRDAAVRTRAASVADTIDEAATIRLWEDALGAPTWSGPPVWVHGDLHPANLLVRDGRIAAVLDFGDLCAGDPATDLAAAWMLFPLDLHDHFRRAAGEVDDATWRRARGWAVMFATAFLATAADHPTLTAIGERTLETLLTDPTSPDG